MGMLLKKRIKDKYSKATKKDAKNFSADKNRISDSFVTLTKEQVEANRSKAYSYVL